MNKAIIFSKSCEKAIDALDSVEDELEDLGISVAAASDRKLGKAHSVKAFPSLTLFRGGRPLHLEGVNPHDPAAIVIALGRKEVLQLPGKIKKVGKLL